MTVWLENDESAFSLQKLSLRTQAAGKFLYVQKNLRNDTTLTPMACIVMRASIQHERLLERLQYLVTSSND